MRLSDIEAQESVVRALKSCIRRSSVAHAYLFIGPRSTGKTTTALAFAAALNCEDPSPDGDACGICFSCLRIDGESDSDVQIIRPDGNQTKMEQMQEMIRGLSFAPLSGKRRIVILEQADTLNTSSENCILKMLEEPPPYAVLILLSHNPNSLLPTIRSRCLTLRFRRASIEEIERVLQSRSQISDDEARVLAAGAHGAIGRALGLASEEKFMEERRAVIQALREWSEGHPVLAMRTAETFRRLAEPKKNDPDGRTRVRRLTDMLDIILSWYSDVLALKVRGEDAPVINADYMDDLKAWAVRYRRGRLQASIRLIMDVRRYLEGNITPQLALENMLFAMRPD